jgi:hypothetical protein
MPSPYTPAQLLLLFLLPDPRAMPQPLTRGSAPPPLAQGKEAPVVAGPEPRAAASPARTSSAPTLALLAPHLLQHRRPRSSAPAACAPLLRCPSARTRRQRRLSRAAPAPARRVPAPAPRPLVRAPAPRPARTARAAWRRERGGRGGDR